ncbi:serine hydrolase [Fodinibius salsisoli]|uniref:beta-lactamase n=1 Tax=Fodinibius salsisoli TaxID=2820877 RepID=A0ABT3PSS7_9BACT|nr:serine hydrolase [Fodinibius salsisoli]MCW9708906.1 serine hydrolase [Fodinibius salsisoli]
MRILKFIGVTIGTLLLVFFIVFGFNLDALVTLSENSDDLQEGQQWVPKTTSLKGLTEYIAANPERVAVVSRSTVNADTTISYGGNEQHTMGTLSNFFLIATYARLVEADSLDPDELIPLTQIDRYQLPYIDASNHTDAKTSLTNKGVLREGKAPLDALVRTALVFNDLAISDYLFYKLGQDNISTTFEQLNLQHTDHPLPFSGLYITINPAVTGTTFQPHFETLTAMSEQAFQDTVLANARRYQSDSLYYKKISDTFKAAQGLSMQFRHRRDALSLFPQSTASELSELMVRLQQNELISPAVSKRIKSIMDWPYERQSLNSDFTYYGALYDNRMGLLNGLDYGASTYSEEPFGQAVFFDSLQVAFWFHMSSTLMHQDYQQRLMWDPALREATMQQINK